MPVSGNNLQKIRGKIIKPIEYNNIQVTNGVVINLFFFHISIIMGKIMIIIDMSDSIMINMSNSTNFFLLNYYGSIVYLCLIWYATW